jgi:hypothetical protein
VYLASSYGHAPVVRLLVERGADPTITGILGATPLNEACSGGHLEVVRSLLGHPRADIIVSQRKRCDGTALYRACTWGRVDIVRLLLKSGADPTIPEWNGTTPMAIAKKVTPRLKAGIAEGRRECVAALEVSSRPPFHSAASWVLSQLAEAWGGCCVVWGMVDWQDAERAYVIWKARQVADQQGSGAVAVGGEGEEAEARKALLDFAVHGLKEDLFLDVVDYMWDVGCPVRPIPLAGRSDRGRRSSCKPRDAMAHLSAADRHVHVLRALGIAIVLLWHTTRALYLRLGSLVLE